MVVVDYFAEAYLGLLSGGHIVALNSYVECYSIFHRDMIQCPASNS